jgi:hypothetical protein
VLRYFTGELKANLEQTGFEFNKDWDKVTNQEGVEVLRRIEGMSASMRGGVQALESGYVMTV